MADAPSKAPRTPSAIDGGSYVAFHDAFFRYHEDAPDILTDFALSMRRGEFLVLLGPSGCGKTTALNLLAGFELPTRGEVVVAGERITGPAPDRIVIFQGDDSLLTWRTVWSNVEFGLSIAGIGRSDRRRRVEEALEMVGLTGEERKYPHELSGGMKQRVQIARALVCDAPILLMDEPFGALDAQTRASLQDELARIWAATSRTILFITHDISESVILGDRVGVMSRRGGAIRELFMNDLPRPRRRGDVEFARMYARIEECVTEAQ